MKALGKMLQENAQLESVDLSNNLIRGKAIDAIAVAVQTHPSLRALLLQWNSIGGSPVVSFFDCPTVFMNALHYLVSFSASLCAPGSLSAYLSAYSPLLCICLLHLSICHSL